LSGIPKRSSRFGRLQDPELHQKCAGLSYEGRIQFGIPQSKGRSRKEIANLARGK
jgi:hypothetical protein